MHRVNLTNMTDSEFEECVDDTLLAIEDVLDNCHIDIEYENTGGILTLEFANQSKIIINRQIAVHQLWIAAKSGGFHLEYESTSDTWKTNKQGEELFDLLGRLCSEQAGESISFNEL